MKLPATIAFALALAASPALGAQSRDGASGPASWLPANGGGLGETIRDCRMREMNRGDARDMRACYGLQAGMILAYLFYPTMDGGKPPFCLDGTVTDRDINDAILAFLKAHPDDHDLSAPATVLGAMIEAFPCADRGTAR